ncbi:MAG: hypothetical protein ACI81O_000179 [Cyclobacteriaceae bacterium]|jgi:hypothetical protein
MADLLENTNDTLGLPRILDIIAIAALCALPIGAAMLLL